MKIRFFMACVFGEMRTLKTSERWGNMYDGQVSRNSVNSGNTAISAGSVWRPPLVPVSSIVSSPTHRISLVSFPRVFPQP